MPYNLEVTEAAHKVFSKLAKKDEVILNEINYKVEEIL